MTKKLDKLKSTGAVTQAARPPKLRLEWTDDNVLRINELLPISWTGSGVN